MTSSTPPAPSFLAWETFPHGADIGVRGYGATPAEAFAGAATALTSVVADPRDVRTTTGVPFACAAPDTELLLLDWLNALVSTMAIDRMLFSRFDVKLRHDRLTAVAYGEPIDPDRHRPAVEVKGATATLLRVVCDADGRWRAQCVVDV